MASRSLPRCSGNRRWQLNPEHGVEKPRTLARIVEADCIGCTKCIQACPVDAIVGAAKLMHTVIADDCTGCELCVPACPVDCIVLEPMPLRAARCRPRRCRTPAFPAPRGAPGARARVARRRTGRTQGGRRRLRHAGQPGAGSTRPRQGQKAGTHRMKRADVIEMFSRLRELESASDHRTGLHHAVRAAGGGGAVGAGHRCRRQQGHAQAVSGREYAAGDVRAGRGRPQALHQHDRLVQCQGEERDRAVPPAAGPARRRGAAQPRGAGSPARRGTQDRQRGAQHRLRRAHDCGGHAYLPRFQPYRAGAGQGRARGGRQAGEGDPGRVQGRRPPLADPARALRMQGTQAGLPALRDPRPLPLSRTRPRHKARVFRSHKKQTAGCARRFPSLGRTPFR